MCSAVGLTTGDRICCFQGYIKKRQHFWEKDSSFGLIKLCGIFCHFCGRYVMLRSVLNKSNWKTTRRNLVFMWEAHTKTWNDFKQQKRFFIDSIFLCDKEFYGGRQFQRYTIPVRNIIIIWSQLECLIGCHCNNAHLFSNLLGFFVNFNVLKSKFVTN